MEKELYQVTNSDIGSYAVMWNKLPEKVINKIKPGNMHNVISYSGDDKLELRTVIYFKKVEKIAKHCTRVETDNIIFGV